MSSERRRYLAPISQLSGRLTRAVSRYGVLGAARRAWEKLARQSVLSESHVWYHLGLAATRPSRPLAPELRLWRGTESDVPLLDMIETVWPAEARARLADGNDWWLVQEQGPPLFSCWIFRERTPVLGAPHGQLELPAGHVCLEDSFTSAAARGRGIAPAAWGAIADSLAAEGEHHMITKVAVTNAASRRAVEKAGFEAVALMHFTRRGPRRRISVELLDPSRGGVIADALGIRTPTG